MGNAYFVNKCMGVVLFDFFLGKVKDWSIIRALQFDVWDFMHSLGLNLSPVLKEKKSIHHFLMVNVNPRRKSGTQSNYDIFPTTHPMSVSGFHNKVSLYVRSFSGKTPSKSITLLM